jgi:hypothetical protein
MASVITITITESETQIVSGIPQSVSISTNIPATIFYTLNGTVPSLFSTIYTASIILPTDTMTVDLNVFATNGTITSPVIYNSYFTDNTTCADQRVGHSGTNAPAQPCGTLGNIDPAPFGAPSLFPNQQFLGVAAAGLTVDNPQLTEIPQGFDGNGNPTNFTNGQDPYGIPSKSFGYLYSNSGADGGIGTFPPHTVIRPPPPPEQSNMASPFFDPRAQVVIQDTTQPINPLLPIQINRMQFSMEDVQHTRTGNQMFNTALEGPPTTGGLTRSQYNPVDNSMTYYYWDSTSLRWLVSRQNFQPKPTFITDYSSAMVMGGIPGNPQGAQFVFQWNVFGPSSYLH